MAEKCCWDGSGRQVGNVLPRDISEMLEGVDLSENHEAMHVYTEYIKFVRGIYLGVVAPYNMKYSTYARWDDKTKTARGTVAGWTRGLLVDEVRHRCHQAAMGSGRRRRGSSHELPLHVAVELLQGSGWTGMNDANPFHLNILGELCERHDNVVRPIAEASEFWKEGKVLARDDYAKALSDVLEAVEQHEAVNHPKEDL